MTSAETWHWHPDGGAEFEDGIVRLRFDAEGRIAAGGVLAVGWPLDTAPPDKDTPQYREWARQVARLQARWRAEPRPPGIPGPPEAGGEGGDGT